MKTISNSARVLKSARILIVFASICFAFLSMAQAQEELQNRVLTGTLDLGDIGRYVGASSSGVTKLGDLTITGDSLLASEAHVVGIAKDGFAWLSNGFALRNGSGSDLAFDGPNQSHDLELYFFGYKNPEHYTAITPIPGFNNPLASLSGVDQYDNSEGNSVSAFGGYWFQEGVYLEPSAEAENVVFTKPSESSGISPATLLSGSFFENDNSFNRVNSTKPTPLVPVIRSIFAPPLYLQEAESQTAERRNSLFSVTQTDTEQPAPTLDLSGIEIGGSGSSVRDRVLGGGVVSVGRVMVGSPDQTISRTDTVGIVTYGVDEQFTRLQLESFNVSGNGIQAVHTGPSLFDSETSTASVSLTGNFTIDGDTIGTVFKGFNQGTSITSLENLLGENKQSNLRVGYQYSVVDNNEAESRGLTVFKLGNHDTTGEQIYNHWVDQKFLTDSYTNITFDRDITLNGSAVQTIAMSEGNGITGEGLVGENVIAETTFNVYTQSVATSQLEHTPQGFVGESPIEISNARVPNASVPQATAFVVGSSLSGSKRWYFNGREGDLSPGNGWNLTPVFDDTGLSPGELGRNYRSEFSLLLQDGIKNADDFVVGDSVDVNGFYFDLYGSEESQQTLRWVVERAQVVEGTSGSVTLAAGSSLRSEGINLTNTLGNSSSEESITTLTLLDGTTNSDADTMIEVLFNTRADATNAQQMADGFDALASDLVNLTGLDGTPHVIQIGIPGNFELYHDLQVKWYDEGAADVEGDEAWVNAILGNSNIAGYDFMTDTVLLSGSTDTQSLSEYLSMLLNPTSYTDYLLSLEAGVTPELGAYGYDLENGVAWAFIDHNSTFGLVTTAVPEPSSLALFGLGMAGTCLRRRKSKGVRVAAVTSV